MKAFEKWQEERIIKILTHLDNLFTFKAGEKEGWRAALEWTLRMSKELDEQDAPISMQEVIEQELEN